MRARASAARFVDNPDYRRYQAFLKQLHDLNATGKLDSDEADDVREQMEGLWDALDEVERRRLAGLSADLYSFTGEEPPGDVGPEALVALQHAYQRRGWEDVLALLRQAHSRLPPAQVAFVRGRAWEELGDALAASWFYDHAHALSPADGTAEFMALGALVKAGRQKEAIARAEKRLGVESAQPRSVFAAANILVGASRELPEAERTKICSAVIAPLRKAIDEEKRLGGARLPSATIGAWFNLALALEGAGELGEARQTYAEAVEAFPNSHELLAAQALFLLRVGAEAEARSLLNALVALGTALVYPYLFLAHRALLERRFDAAWKLCTDGLQRTLRDDVRASFLEWAAIAQFELGGPRGTVRELFEAALRHDPMNPRIRRNLEEFERAFLAREARGSSAGSGRVEAAVTPAFDVVAMMSPAQMQEELGAALPMAA